MKHTYKHRILSAFLACPLLLSPVSGTSVFAAESTVVSDDPVELTATFLSGAGGTFADGSTSVVKEFTEHHPMGIDSIPAITTKPGYTFLGWSVDGSDRFYSSATLARMVLTGAHTIEAQYSRASYNVTFSAGDHGTLTGETALTLPVGDMVGSVPGVQADAGYTFAGWQLDGKLYSDEEVQAMEMPAQDLSFVAVFDPITLSLTVDAGEHATFAEGKTQIVLSDIAYGTVLSDVTLPEPVVSEGYVFKGWMLDGKQIDDLSSVSITTDMTLRAVCEKVEEPEPEPKPEPKPAPEEKKPVKTNKKVSAVPTAANLSLSTTAFTALTSLAGIVMLKRRR